MSVKGHERRPFKWGLLDNFRYSPGSDRGRGAAQHVAKGQKATFLAGVRALGEGFAHFVGLVRGQP